MKYVEVKYNTSYNTYEFMTDLEIAKGDTVVCDSSNGFQVAKVLKVSDEPINHRKVHKWIVDKVNVEAHNERMSKEKKLKELRQKMEQRRKKIETIQVYRLLAQEDEEMASLLKELEGLDK